MHLGVQKNSQIYFCEIFSEICLFSLGNFSFLNFGIAFEALSNWACFFGFSNSVIYVRLLGSRAVGKSKKNTPRAQSLAGYAEIQKVKIP